LFRSEEVQHVFFQLSQRESINNAKKVLSLTYARHPGGTAKFLIYGTCRFVNRDSHETFW
jgi:hypothetical protein